MDEMIEAEVVYIGQRALKDGKLGDCYIILDAVNRLMKDERETTITKLEVIERISSAFDVGKRAGAVVGCIYNTYIKLEGDRIKSAVTKSKKYLRRFDNNEFVSLWETKDKSVKLDRQREQMVKKMANNPVLENELKMLKSLYNKTSYRDRMAFEMMILSYLRR